MRLDAYLRSFTVLSLAVSAAAQNATEWKLDRLIIAIKDRKSVIGFAINYNITGVGLAEANCTRE
jgi:hypothetical protein